MVSHSSNNPLHYPGMLFISLMLAIFSSTALAANITVRASANPIALDDSFHLIYEADSSVDDDPDFSPLEQDFDILNSSQSTNMRLVNGNYSLKKTWDLALIAKDVGNFTVPSISFGRDKSPAIRLTIKNSVTPNSTLPNGQASIPAKIFLESSIDKKQSWVQEQIIYTVRLLRTVSITGASLSEPTTSDADAIIQRLGEDNSYQTTRRGIRYEVIERRYVIFPQHSGKLTINPVTFEGRVNATQPRTIFDQFRMSGQLKRLRSKAVNTIIKAKPADINTQDWLPASNLTLVEDWSGDISNAKTGEPITRTISIVAKGLSGIQLPDLSFADVDNLKQYPDKAVTTDSPENVGINGAKQIKVALIPAAPGEYLLPEIKLPWWNTRTNQAEVATIPETRLIVTGAALQVQQTMPPAAPAAVNTETETAIQSGAQTEKTSTVTSDNDVQFWKWLSFALATGWLLTLIYLLLTRSAAAGAGPEKAQKTKPASSLTALEKSVLQACKNVSADSSTANSSLEKLKNTLLQWAQGRWPDQHISSLTQLANYCPSSLKQEIQWLNQTLYNPAIKTQPDISQHIKTLAKEFKAFRSGKKRAADKQAAALEPLYKS